MCEICQKAHMRQRRYARTQPAADDELPAPDEPNQQLSSDTLIIAKTHTDLDKAASSGNTGLHVIRDSYSGMSVAIPQRERTMASNMFNFKYFTGPAVKNGSILVRTDAARELTGAVSALGWHPEASLENRWPHNSHHERFQGTLKSVIRSMMQQSGFPADSWDIAAPYASIALSITQPAPIADSEKDAAGNVLERFRAKADLSCWEAHHRGSSFTGVKQPFGRLCYFLDRATHPLMPTTVPGLFLGWRLERGLRFRGVLYIGDYDLIRTKGVLARFIRSVPTQEVHFPDELVFPFAEARARALCDMTDLQPPLPAQPLPFAIDAGEVEIKDTLDVGKHAPAAPRFRITLKRLVEYEATPGCKACEEVSDTRPHSAACRTRFRGLLERDGLIDKVEGEQAGASDSAPPNVWAGEAPDGAEPADSFQEQQAMDFLFEEPDDDRKAECDHAPPFAEGDEEECFGLDPPERAPQMFVQTDAYAVDDEREHAPSPPPSASQALAVKLSRSKPLQHGLTAACAAVDRIYEEAMRFYDTMTANALFNAAVHNIRQAKQNSISNRSTRPSERLPGRPHIFDINFVTDGYLEPILSDYDGLQCHEVEYITHLEENINKFPGCYMHATLPSDTWSIESWNEVKNASLKRKRRYEAQRSLSVIVFRHFARGADTCLDQGGRISFVYPSDSLIWLNKDIINFIHKHSITTVDMCDGDQKWRFAVSDSQQAKTLHNLSLKPAEHEQPANGMTAPSDRMVRSLMSSAYEYQPFAPAMCCVPPTQQGHREKEPDETSFGMSVPLSWPFGFSDDNLRDSSPSLAGSGRAFAAVTKLLDRKDVRNDPKAMEAIRNEGKALQLSETWDEKTVVEREDLLAQSRAEGSTIHVGELMTLCSIKYWEMEESARRYKGRIVFRGDSTKDQNGSAAIFQELGSHPTTVQDINSNLAYGAIKGHKTSVADAIRAYVQSTLKSKHPTWVAIPRELWPPSWHARGYRRPMCRLRKALYGHPESGGHWEAHLNAAIIAIGGRPVADHPSSYWFPQQRLLLTVYVDDLLLSGPSDRHDEVWRLLGAKIDIEDPEPLDRFLGRSHQITDTQAGSSLEFCMEEYCVDAVNLYSSITGTTKYKEVTTPFVPDGSITEQDEETKGELSEKCCSVLMKALWLARLARPDVIKPIGDLATHIQKWSRGDDKRLYRLICYLNGSRNFRLQGYVHDDASNLWLELYVDADFCGETLDTKSTSGGYLILRGPDTLFPLWWVSKRQSCTSRSTTEAEIVSLATALFSEGLPSMSLWDLLLQRPVQLRIFEDNQATIKVAVKGYSPKLRHVLRTHKVNLGSIKEILDSDAVSIEYVKTEDQRADIFTKALQPLKWDNALQLLNIHKH